MVALRKESVDRNLCIVPNGRFRLLVALRKESVDRNLHMPALNEDEKVALRKESVDRNNWASWTLCFTRSLSARRAWIEIRSWLVKHPRC